ncbi:MAG: hypothetical protein RMA76_03340 [Deltaproteobacteria bacterium]|jgi:hypothetical protein
MKTALYLGLFLLALFAAPEAYACPMCALNDKAGLGSWFILAGMLGMPFVVAGTAIVVMRKIGTQSVADSTSPQAK